jgi:hypothetical protein
MSSLMTELPRRSSRVFRRVRISVNGKNSDGRKFREAAQTIVINAHGGLMYLTHFVEMGAMLTIANPLTDEELECRVVYLGDIEDRGQRVGVEFLSPCPHFWGVEFAQADWTPPQSIPAT